ncbi:MAG TPA: hypothetical protein VMU14_02290 [Acidimicrobiales bacterium]|nr:hypothetical protein [Acidimicrobiales bacterium]
MVGPDAAEVLTDLVPRLYRVLRSALDEDAALPSLEQLRVMARIEEGVRHASELALVRDMRVSAITPLVDGLDERGWLVRRRGRPDRRSVELSLTPAGRRALAAGRRRASGRLREVLGHVPAADRATLGDLAGVLAEAVSRYDAARLAALQDRPLAR